MEIFLRFRYSVHQKKHKYYTNRIISLNSWTGRCFYNLGLLNFSLIFIESDKDNFTWRKISPITSSRDEGSSYKINNSFIWQNLEIY